MLVARVVAFGVELERGMGDILSEELVEDCGDLLIVWVVQEI